MIFFFDAVPRAISLFIYPVVVILIIFEVTTVFSSRLPVISHLKRQRSFGGRKHIYDHTNKPSLQRKYSKKQPSVRYEYPLMILSPLS
jgi:hypothetical protein